jgi:hypothetical protein
MQPALGNAAAAGGEKMTSAADAFLALFADLVAPEQAVDARPAGKFSLPAASFSETSFVPAAFDGTGVQDDDQQDDDKVETSPREGDAETPMSPLSIQPSPLPAIPAPAGESETSLTTNGDIQGSPDRQCVLSPPQLPAAASPFVSCAPNGPEFQVVSDSENVAPQSQLAVSRNVGISPMSETDNHQPTGADQIVPDSRLETPTTNAFTLSVRSGRSDSSAAEVDITNDEQNLVEHGSEDQPEDGAIKTKRLAAKDTNSHRVKDGFPIEAGVKQDQAQQQDHQPGRERSENKVRKAGDERLPQQSPVARETPESKVQKAETYAAEPHFPVEHQKAANVIQNEAADSQKLEPPTRAEFRGIEELRLTGPQLPRTGSIQDIEIRLPSAGNPIDLKLVEKNGQVEISVRSGNTQLASDLRAKLPDLLQSLESRGYEATVEPQPVDRGIATPAPSQRAFDGDANHESAKRQHQQPNQQKKEKSSRNGRMFAAHLELGTPIRGIQ